LKLHSAEYGLVLDSRCLGPGRAECDNLEETRWNTTNCSTGWPWPDYCWLPAWRARRWPILPPAPPSRSA